MTVPEPYNSSPSVAAAAAWPRLLLVNDDEDGLFLLERAMRKDFPTGTLHRAHDGVAGLAVAIREPLDLIVTDSRMPHMTGMTMVLAIRARGIDIPILMLTGAEDARDEATRVGVTRFLTKGSWEEIRQAVRNLLPPRNPRSSGA